MFVELLLVLLFRTCRGEIEGIAEQSFCSRQGQRLDAEIANDLLGSGKSTIDYKPCQQVSECLYRKQLTQEDG